MGCAHRHRLGPAEPCRPHHLRQRLLERSSFGSRWNYAAALALDFVGPVLRAAAELRALAKRTPPDSWRRGVILGNARIGDVLYRTASLPDLARGLPQCKWTYLASAAGAAVLVGNPHVSDVVEIAGEPGSRAYRRQLYRLLREGRFDAVLCTNSVGYADDLVIAAAAGIPNRVALTHKGLGALATLPVPAGFPRSIPEYVRSIVAAVTGRAPEWRLQPQLFPSPSDAAAARAAHARLHLDGRPVIACAPATRELRGTWPIGIFVPMLQRLAPDHNIVLCGARSDEPLLKQLAERAGIPPLILAGELNIRALGVFFALCKAVLAHDSGPRHVANATGTPVGFFRILAVHPVESGRYCDTEIDLAPATSGPLDEDHARDMIARTSPGDALDRFLEFLSAQDNRTRAGPAPTASPPMNG